MHRAVAARWQARPAEALPGDPGSPASDRRGGTGAGRRLDRAGRRRPLRRRRERPADPRPARRGGSPDPPPAGRDVGRRPLPPREEAGPLATRTDRQGTHPQPGRRSRAAAGARRGVRARGHRHPGAGAEAGRRPPDRRSRTARRTRRPRTPVEPGPPGPGGGAARSGRRSRRGIRPLPGDPAAAPGPGPARPRAGDGRRDRGTRRGGHQRAHRHRRGVRARPGRTGTARVPGPCGPRRGAASRAGGPLVARPRAVPLVHARAARSGARGRPCPGRATDGHTPAGPRVLAQRLSPHRDRRRRPCARGRGRPAHGVPAAALPPRHALRGDGLAGPARAGRPAGRVRPSR